MLVFQLLSLHYAPENINLVEKTITIRPNIKYLYLSLSYYPEKVYISKHNPETFYDWKQFMSLWFNTIT